MLNYNFVIDNIRFSLKDNKIIYFTGWYRDDNPECRTLKVLLGRKPVDVEYQINEGSDIRRKYLKYEANVGQEVLGKICLPDDWNEKGKLTFICDNEEVYSISVRELVAKKREVPFKVESDMVQGGRARIIGWAAGENPVKIELIQGTRLLDPDVSRKKRPEIDVSFPEIASANGELGFDIDAKLHGSSWLKLRLSDGVRSSEQIIYTGKVAKARKMADKLIDYNRRNGKDAAIERIMTKLKSADQGKNDYSADWEHLYSASKAELEKQRRIGFEYNLKFSIAVPLYNTNRQFLKELIESVMAQTYTNWELCMADGTGKDSPLQDILKEYSERDSRVRYTILDENLGISGNTNAAVKLATGDYIVLADHDDIVAPNALFECASIINADRTVDVIYSDEDKIDMKGKTYFSPHIKPDFNIDLLRSNNYICHLFVMKRELMESIADNGEYFRPAFDGSQDYDIILRCCEKAENIRHIGKILYHWRESMDSTSVNPDSKMYAYEAGRRALDAHFERVGIDAHAEHGLYYGLYRVFYHMEDEPLVSVIIPVSDNTEDQVFERCLENIRNRSEYKNIEIITPRSDSFYEACADGALMAHGEYLLFMDNSMLFINKDAVSNMVSLLRRTDVGVVGPRIYDKDDRIYHAGIITGHSDDVKYFAKGTPRTDKGYRSRIVCTMDYDAVDGCCFMTKRSVFESVGGFADADGKTFDNIGYCRKVRKLGKLVVYQPYAEARNCE